MTISWRGTRSTCSRPFSSRNRARATGAARRALRWHLAQTAEAAEVVEAAIAEWHRVRRPLPAPAPLVSLIVPTRDQVTLLKRCVDGLLDRTRYERLEL